MSSTTDIPTRALEQLGATVVREHMSLDQAIESQFALVDAIQGVMGSDVYLTEDYGQVRELATVGFGGGGRPRATARVEQALATFFGTPDAVLVHGAGTGAIRAMLNAALPAGGSVVLHSAHAYKTTLPAMNHMGLRLHRADFNDVEAVRRVIQETQPDGLFVQHVPQGLGDDHRIEDVIAAARTAGGERPTVIVDDNYAVMRSRKVGVQMGADATAFSLFKLLSPAQVGCVLGDEGLVSSIRRDLSSAGCQVQGPAAMQSLRMLVFAPVALAIQNRTVLEVTERINTLAMGGKLPYVRGAVAAQPGIRCCVLVFDEPVAEAFVRSAWRNGSPSQSVGEEAQPEILPLFTYLTSTFLKGMPGLERYAMRINPMRGGASTILRVVEAALADHEFKKDVAGVSR